MVRRISGIPFAIGLAACVDLLLPRYEIRPVGDTGAFVRVDRWRGDIVFQTTIEERDLRGRRVLDGGMQFASIPISAAFSNGLIQERQRATPRRQTAFGLVAAGFGVSVAVGFLSRRKLWHSSSF